MQIKTTIKYHLISVRMANIKKASVGKNVEEREPSYTSSEIGVATVENSTEIPQKIKNRTAI